LNLFNAAMVTPTYYVYFTSTTIITSAVLFQGFKGSATSIITVVMGFLIICSGVVLLQLSKSAKDVPDTAVFSGDLDQIHTIAEQEQPETEPKADAIRGAAAIVRRISVARQKMEAKDFERLHQEKEAQRLETLSEDGQAQFEWDGLRRRRTTMSQRSRAMTSPNPFTHPQGAPFTPPPRTPHPPLGMSHFPSEEEMEEEERNRQASPGLLSSIAGTIRSRARSVILPGHPDYKDGSSNTKVQSPMHPVQLTNIAVPSQKTGGSDSPYGMTREHVYGLPDSLRRQDTEYGGAAAAAAASSTSTVTTGTADRHIQFGDAQPSASASSLAVPPTPPPHRDGQSARRQFSFQNVFRRHQADGAQEAETRQPQSILKPTRAGIGSRGYSSPQVKDATEEERLGLVKGDSHSMPALPQYDDDYYDDDDDPELYLEEKRAQRYGRGITGSPPRRGSDDKATEAAGYESSRSRRNGSRGGSRQNTPPRGSPPRQSPPRPAPGRRDPPPGGNGAFI
jgi:magnesium transporter